jgi:hypothetical protein
VVYVCDGGVKNECNPGPRGYILRACQRVVVRAPIFKNFKPRGEGVQFMTRPPGAESDTRHIHTTKKRTYSIQD